MEEPGRETNEGSGSQQPNRGCWRAVGRGWGNWVTGTGEGTGCDKSRVFCATDEPLNSTSETDDVVYAG